MKPGRHPILKHFIFMIINFILRWSPIKAS